MSELYEKHHENYMRIVRGMVATHGETAQLNMVKEELAELIVAISHLERGRDDAESEVMEELADVEFMLDQLKHIMARRFDYKPVHFEWHKYFTAGVDLSVSEAA